MIRIYGTTQAGKEGAMRITWLGVALATCIAGQARADVPAWAQPSTGEIVALAAMESLIAVDVIQTVRAHNRMPDFAEANPLLGVHPSTERILLVGAAGGLAAAGLWYALPSKVRYLVPALVGFAEVLVIANNARSAGARFLF